MGYGPQDSVTNSEPRVQQLVTEPYWETGMGPQGLAGAGFRVIETLPTLLDFPARCVIHVVGGLLRKGRKNTKNRKITWVHLLDFYPSLP